MRNKITKYYPILILLTLIGCIDTSQKPETWVFLMAGQSNMAGRGVVESQDTITDSRIFSINQEGELILAKEPLHFYEPNRAGLDCGLSFGEKIISNTPEHISVLMIPTAVGNSSIRQWIDNDTCRNVVLLSNFEEKMTIGKNHGKIKGILWHQGESDDGENELLNYKDNLKELISKFRNLGDNPSLPILIGELGSFSVDNDNWQKINQTIHEYSQTDSRCYVISTSDLKDKGDQIHFNSEGQRAMGERFANKILEIFQY